MTARRYPVHLCDPVLPDDADATPALWGRCRGCGVVPWAGEARRSDDFARLRRLEDEARIVWQRQECE